MPSPVSQRIDPASEIAPPKLAAKPLADGWRAIPLPKRTSVRFTSADDSQQVHRIDSSHLANPAGQLKNNGQPEKEDAVARAIRDDQASHSEHDSWLQMHGADLIERLQTWAAELDAREAQLNARSAIQEQLERQFRLRQQNQLAELAEQKRFSDRVESELRIRARRLAFENS